MLSLAPSLSTLLTSFRLHAIREVLSDVVGTLKQSERSKHPNAQASFNRRLGGKVYPFSSVRQDSRQRRQFDLRETKLAEQAHQDLGPFTRLWLNSHLVVADDAAEACKAAIRTVAADGTVTYQWEDSEGCNTLWTNIPDPGPVFHTPHASVPIAGTRPDVAWSPTKDKS